MVLGMGTRPYKPWNLNFFYLKLWGCYHKDVNRNEEERDQPTRTGGRSMEQLLEALRKPSAYSHPTGPIEVAETHISWVFLAGNYAYKVKKPVNLGFLDFSTLEQRKFYCHEELRLNRRLCRDLYLSRAPHCSERGRTSGRR